MKSPKLFIAIVIAFFLAMKLQAQSPMPAMNKFAGDWKVEFIMWMDPSAPTMNSELTAHREMIMNGLFLTSYYTGQSMGMKYEAISTLGFNLEKKVYVSSWIDNMNSGISYSEGKASADGKSIEFRGTNVDAISGKDIPMRQVLTFVDDSHQKIEIFETKDGKEMKTTEFDLTK